ncbi:hypothetical protein NX059_004658 [Plenodomus lindquistii]|nr:hypothetical protein NX059_004658 [Plenodomus lindquistii]
MSGFLGNVYNAVLRSNTTMLFTVFGAAFGMQLAFDTGSDKVWDAMNRGVCLSKRMYVRLSADTSDSANGRTSSSDTWSRPRMTSRSAPALSFERDIDKRLARFRGTHKLYIAVYSTGCEIPFTANC